MSNQNQLSFSATSSYYDIQISKNPKSAFTQFYNTGSIDALGDRVNIDLPNVDFYLNGGIYRSTNYSLTLNGKDFYSNNGTFEVGSSMTLNFENFTNKSGVKVISNGNLVINLVNRFNNNSTLIIDRAFGSVKIKGGDFYNGSALYNGSIVLNQGSLNIEKDLISQGISDTYRSKIQINKSHFLTVTGNLINGAYSDISINGGSLSIDGSLTNKNHSKIEINKSGSLLVKGNLTNSQDSDIIFLGDMNPLNVNGNLINEGRIYASTPYTNIIFGNFTNKSGAEIHFSGGFISSIGGDFISEPGSRLYLSGNDRYALGIYTNIQAKNINIKGALVYFSKGTALINQPYYFLTAHDGTLDYDSSLLGVQDVLSDDGSVNEFYEALIEPVSDSKKSLQVTFKSKEVNISDESEKTIINIFSKETPILGFDIKNLSMRQIRTISQNINDGFRHYADSKDSALSNGFEVLKANVFARMVGGSTSNSYQSRSARLPYNVFAHYATNSQDSSQDMANILEEIAQSQKENNLYVNLLGAFQSSKGGYGYGYGLSVGYDRSFEDKIFVGAYLAYIGGGSKFDMLSSQTQGFEVGVYGRFETSIIETDLILNQGYAYNKNTKNITILSNTFATYSGYGIQSFDMLLQSGPKFVLGKNSFKPYIGVSVNFYTGANVNEDTDTFASSYDFKDSVYLTESIGIEYKRMFKNGYFFIRPSYEANVWSNASETKVVFLGNSFSIAAPPKEMFGSVLLGGEMRINDSILVNLNLSAKASNQKNFITTGLASLRYVF